MEKRLKRLKSFKQQQRSNVALLVCPLVAAVLTVIFLDTTVAYGLVPKLVTRFCYNSPNPSQVNTQCVYCNYYTFDATMLGCTGTTALSINITAAQAFCVISNCLGQIRQNPIFLGRKKREAESFESNILDEKGGGEIARELSRASRDDNSDEISEDELASIGEENGKPIEVRFVNNERFLVSKQVEALIVDLPEMMDENLSAG